MKRPCPLATESCKYAPDCFADQHHPDWPRKDYTTPLEKQYRRERAIGNYLCRAAHDEIHATTPPPEKPTPDEMRAFLGKPIMEVICTENMNTSVPTTNVA